MKTNASDLDHRTGFQLNLLANPNYYGNLDPKDFKTINLKDVVQPIVLSETYEQLKCVSYHPKTKELRATVFIPKQTGYLGDHCTMGSREYIRFYIDYTNNGSFEDLGMTSFKIYDMENHKGLCYGVKLKIKPEVTRRCKDEAVLPNVRAILSWNIAPPANTPNFKPVWGSVKEARIQIAPRLQLTIPPIFKNPIDINDNLLSDLQLQAIPNFKNPVLKVSHLKKQYDKSVDDVRIVSMTLPQLTNFNLNTLIANNHQLQLAEIDIPKVFEILKKPNFNTTYEELHCVALNRRFDELHADIQIKKSAGYSGDLCSKGSKEYVAFYMDFGTGWEFMGTSSVKVYDIREIPKGGLWYNTYLPINLTPYQKAYCKEGRARIKGILSWNTPPPPNAPNHIATWGDWEVCDAEIKPLPKGYQGLTNQPWLESLGGVDTDIISDANGLANGPSEMANAIVANYSPFDGKIYVTGKFINQNPAASYKIMLKKPGNAYTAFQDSFNVRVTTINTNLGTESSSTVTQLPVDGFYTYIPKTSGVIQKFVNDDILAIFSFTERGIYECYLESDTGQQSETVAFMVDRDRPEVELNITTEGGNCGKFNKVKHSEIEGTFKVTNDRHLDYLRLKLAPNNPVGTIEATVLTSGNPLLTSKSGNLTIRLDDDNSDLDVVRGTFVINTSKLPACGYTIHLTAEDRTIVNSSSVGKHAIPAIVGFCLDDQ